MQKRRYKGNCFLQNGRDALTFSEAIITLNNTGVTLSNVVTSEKCERF